MHKQRIKYLIQREPLSPMLKIQLKLRKPDFPICAVVNPYPTNVENSVSS